MNMRRQFNTDCEGPISKNDNAFELAQEFIPRGGDLFAKLSKYDDFLADIEKKPGYKAGDTLKLILPFFKAYGVTDADITEFSSRNILLVPKADAALEYIRGIMPAFIISTSYRPYINALCGMIGFPPDDAYCTELALDEYNIPKSEIEYLKEVHQGILELPAIELPASATLKAGNLLEGACIHRFRQADGGRQPCWRIRESGSYKEKLSEDGDRRPKCYLRRRQHHRYGSDEAGERGRWFVGVVQRQ